MKFVLENSVARGKYYKDNYSCVDNIQEAKIFEAFIDVDNKITIKEDFPANAWKSFKIRPIVINNIIPV